MSDAREPVSYRTLRGEGVAEFTEKKSRFVGCASPARTEEEALRYIGTVRTRHPDASGVLYGYCCGPGGALQRYSDEHEPSGGLLILEALKKPGIIGVAAVVRYWGGIKLGAGPLGRAFGRAAAQAVESAGVCIAQRSLLCCIRVAYEVSGAVEYLLKHSPCLLDDVTYADHVAFLVRLRQQDKDSFGSQVANLTAGQARWEELGSCYLCWD